MKFKFNGKALWINLEKYIQITAQGQRHALKRTLEKIILPTHQTHIFWLMTSPHFYTGSTFHCMVHDVLVSTWLLTVHRASLRPSRLTGVYWQSAAQSGPAGPHHTSHYPPGHTTHNINTSQSDEKNWRKKHHPSTHLDPLTQLYDCKDEHTIWCVLSSFM